MIKAVELFAVLTLLVFSFFAGVKYSDSVKSRANWIFENKEEEVELPDLSNETSSEVDSISEENKNLNEDSGQDNLSSPQDSAPIESSEAAKN